MMFKLVKLQRGENHKITNIPRFIFSTKDIAFVYY